MARKIYNIPDERSDEDKRSRFCSNKLLAVDRTVDPANYPAIYPATYPAICTGLEVVGKYRAEAGATWAAARHAWSKRTHGGYRAYAAIIVWRNTPEIRRSWR